MRWGIPSMLMYVYVCIVWLQEAIEIEMVLFHTWIFFSIAIIRIWYLAFVMRWIYRLEVQRGFDSDAIRAVYLVQFTTSPKQRDHLLPPIIARNIMMNNKKYRKLYRWGDKIYSKIGIDTIVCLYVEYSISARVNSRQPFTYNYISLEIFSMQEPPFSYPIRTHNTYADRFQWMCLQHQ